METSHEILCPYCGEQQSIEIDISVHHQSYIDDCQVCCEPIEVDVLVESGDEVIVEVRRSDE